MNEYKGFKTEAAYYSFLRGGLRRIWGRSYPPKNEFIREHRVRAPIGRNGRVIWAAKCSQCEDTFPQSKVEVDHIHPAGTLKGDVAGFIDRLFCDKSNMRIVCKKCHGEISLAERLGCTIDEARIHKKVIAFTKHTASDQNDILKLWQTPKPFPTNAKQRRAAALAFYTEDAKYNQ